MLDLTYLRTFMVVVETGNFNTAAEKLGCVQSTVTFRVKALEREFGAQLLERHRFGKKTEVTKVGRRAYAYAAELLRLAEEAKKAVGALN